MTPDEETEHFWSRVARKEPGDCWLWVGTDPMRNGYATTRYRSDARRPVHRIAYEIANGTIDESAGRRVVLHACDNRLCCNPNHLSIGSYSDNTRDMIAKGRDRWRSKPSAVRKIWMIDAEAIRREYAQGGITQHELAARYDVAPQVIGQTIQGLIHRPKVSTAMRKRLARVAEMFEWVSFAILYSIETGIVPDAEQQAA